jgi:integrase|tara:strand:- start:1347 stop:2573 length:1227 start_codon:yes stop_codon:yes gene_type:complete
MAKFTDIQIKSLVRAGKEIAKSDGDGLTFTLSKNGTAAWVLRYRHSGRQKELTLGRYPDITLRKARELASVARAKIQQGVDVARTKKLEAREKASAKTLSELANDYLIKAKSILAASTYKQRKHHINDVILPKLGSLHVKEVTTADVVHLLEKINSVHVASLVLIALSRIFKHGIAKHVAVSNPCVGISASAICDLPKPTRLRLKLSEDELRVVLLALPSIGIENALSIKILLSTCVRTNELVKSEWADIDFEKAEWKIPDANSKTRKGFTIPLPPATVGWFYELKQLSCGSKYVLPSRVGKQTHIALLTIGVALNKLCKNLTGVRRFTPHDLRSTARSYLTELGVNLIVAERCLNHSLGGLVGIYDQHDYMTERRVALELWTELIVACESGKVWQKTTSNVIQLRGA